MVDYGGSTGAAIRIYDGTTNVYIDTIWWETDGPKLDAINRLPAGNSYSTRIGERKTWVKVYGRLLFDNNIGVNLTKLALDAWRLEDVSPVKIEVIDEGNNYIQFRDANGTAQNYLEGYVMTAPIKNIKGVYTINLYFEDCTE